MAAKVELAMKKTIHSGPFQKIFEFNHFILMASHNNPGSKMVDLTEKPLRNKLEEQVDKEFGQEFVWDDVTYKFEKKVDVEQALVPETANLTLNEST